MKLFPSINFWENALIIRTFTRIRNKATIEKKRKTSQFYEKFGALEIYGK